MEFEKRKLHADRGMAALDRDGGEGKIARDLCSVSSVRLQFVAIPRRHWYLRSLWPCWDGSFFFDCAKIIKVSAPLAEDTRAG